MFTFFFSDPWVTIVYPYFKKFLFISSELTYVIVTVITLDVCKEFDNTDKKLI